MTYEDDLREKLSRDLDVTTWRELRTHAARDRVFLVAPSVPLLDAAVAIGSDDADRVGAWVRSGALTRPTAEQLTAWERALDKPFDCLVLSPYVVAAERPGH